MPRKITITIRLSETGRLTIDAEGPLDGPAAALRLLDEARKLVAQTQPAIAIRLDSDPDLN